MDWDSKKRHTLASRRWTVTFAMAEQAEKEKILAALKNAGHEVTPARHLWRDTEREMYDISFAAAEFLMDTFPGRTHKRILLRLENCRGWLVYEEDSKSAGRGRSNDSLFSARRCR